MMPLVVIDNINSKTSKITGAGVSRDADEAVFQAGLISGDDFFDVLGQVPTALAILTADADFPVRYLNPAFTRLFGYVKDDVQSAMDWTELAYLDPALSQQRFSSWHAAVEQAKRDHSPVPPRESRVRGKDGSYRDVILQTSLLRDLLLLTFTDITERKRLADELHAREKQFRSFVENANDIIYTLDLEGGILYLSPNYQKVLGVDPAELLGKQFPEVLHPNDLPHCLDAFDSALQGQRLTGIEYRVRRADGSWSWQASNLGPIFDDAGRISALIGVGRDINLRKQAEEKLYLSEERYRLLSDNARDVIWTIAPDGTITYVSPSVEQTRGYTPQEAMSQTLEQILTPDSIALNLAYFGEMLADVAAGRRPKAFRGQMEYLCKDGSTYWCDVIATPILAEDGSLVELLGVSRDISEHKRYESELKRAKQATETLNQALEAANERLSCMATTDTLTGLWNRRHFEQAVAHEMVKADRYQQPLSLLIFDIDHFKRVNDTHGHLAGDRVLVELSRIAHQAIREADLLARWGGEEFMILMPSTAAHEAMAVADKLRVTFASHPVAGLGTVTASFGVATYRSGEPLDDWISRADRALYKAKLGGRNRVEWLA